MVTELDCVCTVPPRIVPACVAVTREQELLPVVVGVIAAVVGVAATVLLPAVAVGVELLPVVVVLPPQAASKNKAPIAKMGTRYFTCSQ